MDTIWHDLKILWVIRPFRRLFIARVISNFGNGLYPIALAFGVLELDGAGATELSQVQGALFLPLVLFMLVGGVVADRLPRALVIGTTDIVLSAFVIFSGYLFLVDQQTVTKLIVIAFISGTLNAFWWPAFMGLTPEIVPEDKLQSANSVIAFGANSMNIIGIVAGGVIVAAIGPGLAVLLDGFSFLIAGILVLQLRKFGKKQSDTEHQNSVYDDLIHGWKEFSSRHWVVAVVGGYTIIAMVMESVFAVLGPYNAKLNLDGAKPWSYVLASLSFGMMLGVVVSMRIRPKHPLYIGLVAQFALVSWIVAMGITDALWIIIVLGFLTGVGMDMFMILWQTTLQQNIPRESLSRVSSYDAFGSLAMAPLGLIMAGPIAEKFGIGATLVAFGLLSGVTLLVVISMPSVRKLEAKQQV